MKKEKQIQSKPTTDPASLCELRTVREMCDEFKWLKPGTLRHWIFQADSYEFGNVVCHIGGKVLLHRGEFLAWVQRQNG